VEKNILKNIKYIYIIYLMELNEELITFDRIKSHIKNFKKLTDIQLYFISKLPEDKKYELICLYNNVTTYLTDFITNNH
jgi:hypothetical protein